MKMIKIIMSLMVVFLVSMSSIAYAENDAEVKAAIEQTVSKLEQAVAALDKGDNPKSIAEMVTEAKQLQKSISTSDAKVSIKKSQGSNKLGQAKTALNEGDVAKGSELVKGALADYQEVKSKYNATH